MTAARSEPPRVTGAQSSERVTLALKNLLDHYVRRVESGDVGSWFPETEPVVIAARAALSAPATTAPARVGVFKCAECDAIWRTAAQRDACCTAGAVATPATTGEGEVEREDNTCTACDGSGYDPFAERYCRCKQGMLLASDALAALPPSSGRVAELTEQAKQQAAVIAEITAMNVQLNDKLAALQGSGWQPIETAPRDGTRVLIYVPHGNGLSDQGSFVGFFRKSWWNDFDEDPREYEPTYWQPLPPPPSSEGA